MKVQELQKFKLPDSPGVYFFMGPKREILYIGKATSLKSRVRSYFAKNLVETRGELLVQVVEDAREIKWQMTDSVLEALILEAYLIRKHEPVGNTKDKDDKSFNHVVVTEETFPRLLFVRGKDIEDIEGGAEVEGLTKWGIKYIFGPFPQAGSLKIALKLIRKIFPYRDTCVPFESLSENKRASAQPCFNAQLGLCPGVCDGRISRQEYLRIIQHLRLFFEGKKGQLIRQLERDMKGYAKSEDFEAASRTRNTLFALRHIQDIALIKSDGPSKKAIGEKTFRVEAYDIAHISGVHNVGVMVVAEDGAISKSNYRKFKIRGGTGNNDVAALKEVLRRRLRHEEWHFPDLIVTDGGVAQKNAAEEVLREHFNRPNPAIPVVSVLKNKAHKPEKILGYAKLAREHEKTILLTNSEAHRFAITYHRHLRGKIV